MCSNVPGGREKNAENVEDLTQYSINKYPRGRQNIAKAAILLWSYLYAHSFSFYMWTFSTAQESVGEKKLPQTQFEIWIFSLVYEMRRV